jgi:aryl-alcohol dehydrogenase-like predicted oxidoreductase
MKKNILGKTGIEVSELSFGTIILGKLQTGMTPEETSDVLQKAVELGINFFDTAESYETQNHLRVGLASVKNEVVIATKTHVKHRVNAEKHIEESLHQLDREYIDIYLLHLIESDNDLVERREVLDLLLRLKEKGVIRAIGASAHKVEAARVIASEPDIEVLFALVNSKGLGIPDGSPEDMIEVCKLAKSKGKGIYAMKPLAGGHLRQSPQMAFSYLVNTGAFDSICVGMKTIAEVEMNVSIFEEREVSHEILARIETTQRSLKISRFCCVGCGQCVETCDQGALCLDYSMADESLGKKALSVVDKTKCILCGYCADVCPEFAIRVI